ncbi:MAG: PAS domain S-box protein [Rubrivivax sp.]|nr:PAS domain S-box protein [Rubrivivax sp.]
MSPAVRLPVTVRYALLPALAVALLTVLLLVFAQWLLVDELARRTLLRAQHRAATLALELDESLRGSVREVRTLARSPLLREANPERARAELEALRAQSSHYVWLGLVALDGTVIAGTRGWLEGRSIATRPVYLSARRQTWLGDVHPAVALAQLMQASGEAPQEMVDIGEPVRDADGRVVAVLAAHLGTTWIERLRAAATGEAQQARVPSITVHVLTGSTGRSVLPAPDVPAGVPRRVDAPALVQALDGTRYYAATHDLPAADGPALPWRVLVLQERAAALAPAHRVMQSMAVLGVLGALVVGMLGWWLARRTLRPWSPLFDTVLARLQAEPGRLTMVEGVEGLMRDLDRSLGQTSGSGPEQLLVRLARDARELRRVVDQMPLGIALVDASWRVEYLNPAYTRLLGWTTEQASGRRAGEYHFDAVERVEFARLYEQLWAVPGEVVCRFDALTPGGQRVPVQWHAVPLLDDSGRLEGALVIVQDIRAERLALARADALAGRLRALADAAVDDLMATLDLHGRVLEWSRGAERLTGHAAPAAVGRPLGELLPVGDAVTTWLLQARREGACRIDTPLHTADARPRWFEGSLYALGLATGSARFGVILRDVSAQREVQRALASSEERLRLAIDAAQIGTWEVDLTATPPRLSWSDTYGRTVDLPQQHLPLTPQDAESHVHDDDRAALHAAFEATLKDDLPLQLECRVHGAHGVRWHLVRGRSQRGADGRAVRIVGVGMDVTPRRRAEAELHESRERLVRILQTMAEGLFIMGADERYTMVNAAAEQILGVPAEHLLGRHVDEVPVRRWVVDPEADPRIPRQRLAAGDASVRNLQMGVERPDGTRRVISINALPLHDERGRPDGMVATFTDITERLAAEQALADSRTRLSAIIESASDAIVSVDVEGRITLFNPAAERIFGHRAADMQGRALDVLLPEATQGRHGAHLEAFVRSGTTRRAMAAGRVLGHHADGAPLELDAAISQALVNGQPVLTAILRDVTGRVAQERALESTRRELIELTRRLLDQEKQTTRHLAQALHDELGQTLTALRLHWDALNPSPEVDSGAGSDRLRSRVGQLVDAANRQIRHVLGELRPPLLDEHGLAAALDNELQQHQPVDHTPRLALSVSPRMQAQRWPADVEYAAFMVAREALLNALHHASATRITLRLDGDDDELRLSVQDDGVGVTDAERAGRPGHLGLVGMRERARAVAGVLAIESAPGRGTTVTLTWCVADEPAVSHR